MLNLAFDRRNRVLRVTISGIFASEDMDELDNAISARSVSGNRYPDAMMELLNN